MATSAERLAAELADLKRRIIAMERGSQLAHSTFTTAAGDVVPVLDGVATGVQAKELADTLSAAQEELAADAAVRDTRLTEAESGLTAAQGRLDAAEADLTDAFGQLGTVDSRISTAKGDAVSTAASDAAAKAAAAKAEAIQAAASDAQTKADTARDTAAALAIMAQAYNLNPSFDDWTGVTPANYSMYGAAATKETTLFRRGPNSARFVCDTTVAKGLNFSGGTLAHAPNLDYVTVELTFQLVSGASLSGVGVRIDWQGMTNNQATLVLKDEIPAPITGKWYTVSKTLRRPTNATGTWTAMGGYLMANYSGNSMGALTAKDIVFDWINVRPATNEEITSYGAPALIDAKSDVLIQSTTPASTYQKSTTLWIDTTGSANTPKRWINSAWTVITDKAATDAAAAAVAADQKAQQALNAAGSAQTTADNALTMAGSKGKVFYDTTAPSGTGTATGDLWRQVDASKNVIAEWYWNGSAWQSSMITTSAISNLDVGKLTAGSATIISAVAQKIAAATATFQTVDAKNLYVTDTAAIDTAVANALYAKKISAGKILAGEVLIGGGENRIPWDPTVVAPHTNWNSSVLTPINDVDLGRLIQSNLTGVTAGTYKTFMRLCSGDTASNGRVNSFQVNEGEEYLVKVGIGLGGSYPGGSPKARVYVLFFDADGVQTTTAAGTGISGGYTAVPTYATLDVVIPAGTVSMDVYLQQEHDGNIFVHAPTLTRKTDASLIVTGGVKADKLESELTLSTKIIAGDVAGTHAEMSPSGFRVYAADSGGGAPAEVVRLGVAATDDYFAVTRADGSLAATISQDGKIVGDQVHATEELWYKGMELQAKLDSMPRGLVAAAYRDTDAAANAVSGGPSLPYLRLEVELERDRVYRIRTNQMRMGISSGTTALVVLGYAIGSIASPTNYATLAKYKQTDGETSDHVEELFALISGAQKQTVSFIILFAVYSGSGQCGLRAAGGEPIRLTVEDLGSSAATIGNGVWLDGAVTPPAAKNTYVKQYGSTGSMNYQGNNSQYVYDTGRMYQGLSPAGYGNLKSISIHPSMTADLSGATINYIRVYFNFDHWYYNAGGTARIGLHGFTSVPATFSGSGIAATSTNWPKPGARWVDLPSSVFAGFKSGTYKGVYLEGDSTYTTYGIAQRPTIEISYTK